MSAAQLSAENVKAFALAGNARLTLVSAVTGTRFTYRIRKGSRDGAWFVGVLTGADNESDYAKLGMIASEAFRTFAKVNIGPDAPSFKAFAWAWGHIAKGNIPPTLAVYHEGRCGRCARPLTDPVSIESGLGPECRKRA